MERKFRHQIRQLKLSLYHNRLQSFHLFTFRRQVMVLTFALVHKKTTGSSEVDGVVDLEALQVLTHLPALGEFRINAFKVNLSTKGAGAGTHLEKQNETLDIYRNNFPSVIYLHHQVHKAFVVIAGHRRVRTHHQLPVNFCRQIDMLSWTGKHRYQEI